MRKWPIVVLAVVVFLAAGVFFLNTRFAPYIRSWAIRALAERYESDVTFERLTVLSVYPEVRLVGERLALSYKGRKDVPPLASIRRFSVAGNLLGFIRSPRRFRRLEIEGLEINIEHKPKESVDATIAGGEKKKETKKTSKPFYPFSIAEVVAHDAVLNIFPRAPEKPPHSFQISELNLHSVGIGEAMSFRAALTNPEPPGLIESLGRFGPWVGDDPGKTPVSGSYTFQNADLSYFRGLAGILSSQGKYEGTLDRIEVQGETDTPDFSLNISGNRVHLKTTFMAVVDGTDGDTHLEPVNARFLDSTVICQGDVVGKAGEPGKTISLEVNTSGARVEDLAFISAKGKKPPLMGIVSMRAKLVLPPGNRPIDEKMTLNGEFEIRQAHFTSHEVQEKIDELSRRGLGLRKDQQSSDVTLDFRGSLDLSNAVMTFPTLNFLVPGVVAKLRGSYQLAHEDLDFHGSLSLNAKVSQLTRGVKSFLLKAVDPLFERNGAGTFVPFDITGSRDHPSFKVDLGRTLFRR